MFDKNARVARLVDPLGELLGVDAQALQVAREAAQVLKADLATHMVVEMTDLQGIMGREYARLGGASEAVANAIYEHWLPRSAGGALPSSAAGTLLALADRLDSLVGLFAVGLAPKSTADPYGLRRAALGVIQILVTKGLDLDLREAVDRAAAVQPVEVPASARAEVLDFIAGRLRAWVEEQDWPRDVIAAVLAEQSANPYRALEGLRQLSVWVKRPDWTPLLEGFARCVRITRPEKTRYPIQPERLSDPYEQRLYAAYTAAAAQAADGGNVDAFLMAFEPMLPAITDFFNNVLVNAEDAAVRQNRLGLLQAISAMQQGRADLSHLNGF
jgi:glycyl-tRNA synthetase